MKNEEGLFNHHNKKLILRDHLAVDRTLLAAQRTNLAYIRTAITLFIAAISLIKFFEEIFVHLIGWLLLLATGYILLLGIKNHKKVKKIMEKVENGDLDKNKEIIKNSP